jgi:thioredoxin reductase (NADPH)
VLWTTLGFLLITVLSVWGHLRKGAPAARPAAARSRPCPRCGATVRAKAAQCPRCGVPLQAFELVHAPVAQGGADADAGAPTRAHVRSDVCVGCATCVDACPEEGAITMQGKLAVVDAAHCVGHGECATACPMGAIVMAAGAAVNRVVVPQVDAGFQSSVPGLYIVGELGGRGLIKNAINEGKIAIEAVRRSLAQELPPEDRTVALDVAIVGSGPAGLSAGLEALRCGLSYVVLEQGSLADSVRKYPRHKILFAEPVSIPLYGDLWVGDASKESLLKVWENVVEKTGLRVTTEHRVESVERTGWLFKLRAGGEEFRARRVVLAMGRRGTPRRLGVPGEEAEKVVYDVMEMADFAGRHVLVVGGGDSAIESALGLANQPGTTVTLSYRGENFARVKPRLQEKLQRAVEGGRVTLALNSTVREVRSDVVVLDVKGAPRILPNDDVIVRIGGEPPAAFLERIGVRMVQKEIAIAADAARAG